MSNAAIYLTVGSVGRAWAVQLLDDAGAPVDLTLASNAAFSMTPRAGGAQKVSAPAIIGNGTYTLPDGSSASYTPADGVLIYQPVAADADTAGAFQGQFSYDMPAGPVVDPGAGYLDIIIQAAV